MAAERPCASIRAEPSGNWPARPAEALPARAALAAWLIEEGATVATPDSATPAALPYLRARLHHVEALLLADLASNAAAPTAATEAERLREIENAALALLAALRATHPPDAVRAGIAANRIDAGARDDADQIADQIAASWSGAHPLQRLAAGAARQRTEMKKRATPGPGRANLHGRLHGDPRLRLGIACATLLHDLGLGDRVTSTPDGLLHRLMVQCWCNATGDASAREDGAPAVASRFAERAVASFRSRAQSRE